jgi:P27 family predicted phage terminase small subunit
MVGRKPKPSIVHEMNGYPGKRKPKRREPKPKRCIPLPPAHVTDEVKKAWGKLAGKLDSMHVLTEADAWLLEELSETYVELIELRRDIAAEGRRVEVITTNGSVRMVTNPLVNQLSDAAKRFKALMVECGLTPSSRMRVNSSAEEKEDPADEYLN